MTDEIKRILLLAGLFVVGYLLVQAWNEDHGSPLPPAEEVPAPPGDPDADLPQTAPLDTTNADVPVVPVTESEQESPNSRGTAEAPRLIRIETDKLVLWVNPIGGDIVRADLRAFPVSLGRPDVPITLLDNSVSHTYTAMSGLIGPQGPDSNGRPSYTSARDFWTLSEGEEVLQVPLRFTDDAGNLYVKTLRIQRGNHLVEIEYEIHNNTQETWHGNFFGQLKRHAGPPRIRTSSGFGPAPYVGAALTTPETRYEKISFDDLDEDRYEIQASGGWIAILQHYFLAAWIADPDQKNTYSGRKSRDGNYLVGYVAPRLEVPPGMIGQHSARIYLGPKTQSVLEDLAPNLDLTVDYGFLWWLAQPLFIVLEFIEGVLGNWGFAIIVLTLLVKVVLYPLSEAAYRSMANMRRVAPRLKQLQERHAGDRQKLSQEMMGLYRKEKINPLGGCFPMLLQMPVFLALYWVLFESVELRHAPFIFWITDLAAIDKYFILPIVMGTSMYAQQLLNPPIPDPMQARIMKMLPIIFTVFFAFFPSGLVLYWTVNNVLSMAQQWVANKRVQGGLKSS